MDSKFQFTFKHYIYLLIWWLSLGYALDNNTVLLGLLLAAIFFFFTTFRVLGKLIILMIAVFILTAIFPPLAAVIAIASFIFFILRIKFIAENWRALLVGMYAYGVYLLVVLFNNFFYDHIVIQMASVMFQFFQEGSPQTVNMIGEGGVQASRIIAEYSPIIGHISSYLFPGILTIIFHLLLKWLYKYDYSTDRAFYIMGLTPLIMMAFILPFLKIDINGHEIFHGSFSEGINGIAGTEDIGGSLSLKGDINLPSDLSSMLEQADIDIGDIIDEHATSISPAIEASVATIAVRGIFLVEDYIKRTHESYTVQGENGAPQTVYYTDEEHALIKDVSGNNIGSIYSDKKNFRDIVTLSSGFTYTIEQKTGNIIDAGGKLLGRIKDNIDGSKVLINGKGKIIREFHSDGTIVDENKNLIGNVSVI